MKRSPLKRKTPLKAKSRLKSKSYLRSKEPIKKKSKKKKAQDKIHLAAREISFERSGGRCLICGRPATEGHHFIFQSQSGDDVPENIVPLCFDHHTGDYGIHKGEITHMDIYKKACIERPDIARYAEQHIREWVKHADSELVDRVEAGR